MLVIRDIIEIYQAGNDKVLQALLVDTSRPPKSRHLSDWCADVEPTIHRRPLDNLAGRSSGKELNYDVFWRGRHGVDSPAKLNTAVRV